MKKYSRKIMSLMIKLATIFAVIIGIYIGIKASDTGFMNSKSIFMYFTTQSNILIAVIMFVELVNYILSRKQTRIEQIIKLVGTISITLTGLVFYVVLAPTLGEEIKNIQNVLVHGFVPVASVIDFFLMHDNYNYKYKDSLFVTIPPLLYAIYAGIGYINNWQFGSGLNYPYFFLDWGSSVGALGFSKELPYMGVIWWILILLILIILAGLLFIKIIKLLNKKK